MPLQDDPQKVAFLQSLVKNIKLQETNEKVEEEKQRLLEEVFGSLSAQKASLLAQMTFAIKDREGKKLQSMAEGGQIESLEAADARRTQGLSADQHRTVGEGWAVVSAKLDKLRSATIMVMGEDGKPRAEPVFDGTDELRTEFFEPLVREGLIPETFVPDEFSATQRLLDNAMTEYQNTLRQTKAQQDRDTAEQDFLIGKGDTVASVTRFAAESKAAMLQKFTSISGTDREREANLRAYGDGLLSLYHTADALGAVGDVIPKDQLSAIEVILNPEVIGAGLIMGPLGAAGAIAAEETGVMPHVGGSGGAGGGIESTVLGVAKDVNELRGVGIAKAGEAEAVAGGMDGAAIYGSYDQVSRAQKEIAKASAPARVTAAAAEAVATLGRALTAAVTKVNADAGKAVGAAYRAAANPKAIGDLATTLPAPNAQAVIDTVAAAYETALSGAVTEPAEAVAKFRKVGQAVAVAFKGAARAATLTEDLRLKPDTAFASLEAAGSTAIAKVLAAAPAAAAAPPDADAATGTEFKELFANPAIAEKVKQQADARLEKEALDDLQKSQEEINETERQLSMIDDAGQLLAEQRTISKLIVQLKEDRMVLTFAAGLTREAAKISEMGAKMGAKDIADPTPTTSLMTQVVPALHAVGLTVKLVANIIKAAERWSLWYKFKAKLKIAKSAGSALAPAIENFYNNKKEQIAFHTIEDAMIVAQIVGSVGTASGLGAPIGMAIQKVGEAGQAVTKMAAAMYSDSELQAAWRKTKQAMQNPSNRKQGLQAQLANPTLAMHAIVWAGLEDRDPIARNMMDACGLNEQSLDGEDASPALVRQYLETLLDEDRKMLDATRDFLPDWQPKTLDLSRKCWLICKQRAETKATPALKPGPTAEIEAALKDVEKQALAEATPLAQLQEYPKQVEKLVAALGTYLPISTDGKQHKEVAEMAGRFRGLARTRGEEIARLVAARQPPASPAP